VINIRTAVPATRHLLPPLHTAAGLSTAALLTSQTVAFWLALCGNSLPSLIALLSAFIVAVTISGLLHEAAKSRREMHQFGVWCRPGEQCGC